MANLHSTQTIHTSGRTAMHRAPTTSTDLALSRQFFRLPGNKFQNCARRSVSVIKFPSTQGWNFRQVGRDLLEAGTKPLQRSEVLLNAESVLALAPTATFYSCKHSTQKFL